MSPSWVIVHGAGRAGVGQALGQFQQAREFEAEAQRREQEYRLNRKLAETQVARAEQEMAQAPQRAALAEREMGVMEQRVGLDARRLDLGQREFEAAAQAAEQEREVTKRRLAALDRDMQQEEALQLFQAYRASGVDLGQMREGLNAAGQVLGGGVGRALNMLATMTPTETEVFKRLAPQDQNRFLVDQAEERRLARSEMQREETFGLLELLEMNEVMAPEEGQAMREALGQAETPEEVQGLHQQALASQRKFVVRQVREQRRGRLLGRLEQKLSKLDEAEVPANVIEGLERIAAELKVDPNPVWESYDERVAAVLGGPRGNVTEEVPMPSLMPRGSQPPMAAEEPMAPQQAEPQAGPRPTLTEPEALELLRSAGFDELPEDGTPEAEEAVRLLDSTAARAAEVVDAFAAQENTEGEMSLTALADQAGVPRRVVSDLWKQRQEADVEGTAVKRYARDAMRKMRDFDSEQPDESIVTEMVRRKIVPTRAMGAKTVAFMRSTGW